MVAHPALRSFYALPFALPKVPSYSGKRVEASATTCSCGAQHQVLELSAECGPSMLPNAVRRYQKSGGRPTKTPLGITRILPGARRRGWLQRESRRVVRETEQTRENIFGYSNLQAAFMFNVVKSLAHI